MPKDTASAKETSVGSSVVGFSTQDRLRNNAPCGPATVKRCRRRFGKQNSFPGRYLWVAGQFRAPYRRLRCDGEQTTAQYVSNIYKYYVAYKLVVEQGQSLQ
jgi:hypothetical protein